MSTNKDNISNPPMADMPNRRRYRSQYYPKTLSGYHIESSQTIKQLKHAIEHYLEVDIVEISSSIPWAKDQEKDRARVYAKARRRAQALHNLNPNFTKPPSVVSDPLLGLQSIQEWCIEQEQKSEPAETEQKEIVEVKPGVFGITVDIKELARRAWKGVCSRSKD